MLRTDLLELIRHGESSRLEFKRDDITPQDCAKAMVALANAQGGHLLLGVEDDGNVSGLTRQDADEWVVEIARSKVRPPLDPGTELLRDVAGRDVLVVTVEPGYAVHARWHNQSLQYFLRVGRSSREASAEEQARLLQRRGDSRAELRPVSGIDAQGLDRRRLEWYFGRVREQPLPTDEPGWDRLLRNTELLVEGVDRPVASVAGALLFAPAVGRVLPHSRIDATAYAGMTKAYETQAAEQLSGPLTALVGESGVVDAGLVEQAVSFVQRNTQRTVEWSGPRRADRPVYPDLVLREVVVNALVHRDYSMTASDIELSVYSDRLEVISPGRLPNGVTPDAMRDGVRASRNQILKDTMRDLGYVDHRGLGVPFKIIAGMRAHNGTNPDLEERGESFLVRLRT